MRQTTEHYIDIFRPNSLIIDTWKYEIDAEGKIQISLKGYINTDHIAVVTEFTDPNTCIPKVESYKSSENKDTLIQMTQNAWQIISEPYTTKTGLVDSWLKLLSNDADKIRKYSDDLKKSKKETTTQSQQQLKDQFNALDSNLKKAKTLIATLSVEENRIQAEESLKEIELMVLSERSIIEANLDSQNNNSSPSQSSAYPASVPSTVGHPVSQSPDGIDIEKNEKGEIKTTINICINARTYSIILDFSDPNKVIPAIGTTDSRYRNANPEVKHKITEMLLIKWDEIRKPYVTNKAIAVRMWLDDIHICVTEIQKLSDSLLETLADPKEAKAYKLTLSENLDINIKVLHSDFSHKEEKLKVLISELSDNERDEFNQMLQSFSLEVSNLRRKIDENLKKAKDEIAGSNSNRQSKDSQGKTKDNKGKTASSTPGATLPVSPASQVKSKSKTTSTPGATPPVSPASQVKSKSKTTSTPGATPPVSPASQVKSKSKTEPEAQTKLKPVDQTDSTPKTPALLESNTETGLDTQAGLEPEAQTDSTFETPAVLETEAQTDDSIKSPKSKNETQWGINRLRIFGENGRLNEEINCLKFLVEDLQLEVRMKNSQTELNSNEKQKILPPKKCSFMVGTSKQLIEQYDTLYSKAEELMSELNGRRAAIPVR